MNEKSFAKKDCLCVAKTSLHFLVFSCSTLVHKKHHGGGGGDGPCSLYVAVQLSSFVMALEWLALQEARGPTSRTIYVLIFRLLPSRFVLAFHRQTGRTVFIYL